MPRTPRLVPGLVVLALAAVAGCAGAPASTTELRAGTISSAADLVTPADDDVVLTLTWGEDEPVRLSLEQLEAMRTVTATVEEPFLEDTLAYQGVELRDLLDVAGIPDDVTSLRAVALNEYAVDIPVSVADHSGAVVATREEGAPIPVDAGGPIRLVLTPDHPDVDDESLWIWSLSTLADAGGAPAP